MLRCVLGKVSETRTRPDQPFWSLLPGLQVGTTCCQHREALSWVFHRLPDDVNIMAPKVEMTCPESLC